MRIAIETVSETGSTNADLAQRIAQGGVVPEGTWLITDKQTAGRGRQGRQWLDAPGNFMGSTVVAIRDQDPPIPTLSFVAALALYETVVHRLSSPQDLMLKWPNDVLLDKAKLAGILLERHGDCAIIGIGVNLAAAPLVQGREVLALSAKGPAPQRDAFANDLAAQLATEIARWRETGFDPIRNRWLAASHCVGEQLSVHEGEGITTGTFDGIAEDGALQLRLADGAIRAIRAGDVMLES